MIKYGIPPKDLKKIIKENPQKVILSLSDEELRKLLELKKK